MASVAREIRKSRYRKTAYDAVVRADTMTFTDFRRGPAAIELDQDVGVIANPEAVWFGAGLRVTID